MKCVKCGKEIIDGSSGNVCLNCALKGLKNGTMKPTTTEDMLEESYIRGYNKGKEEVLNKLKKQWAKEYGNDKIDNKSYEIFMKLLEKTGDDSIVDYEDELDYDSDLDYNLEGGYD